MSQIGDLLAHIGKAQQTGDAQLEVPFSTAALALCRCLMSRGLIQAFDVKEQDEAKAVRIRVGSGKIHVIKAIVQSLNLTDRRASLFSGRRIARAVAGGAGSVLDIAGTPQLSLSKRVQAIRGLRGVQGLARDQAAVTIDLKRATCKVKDGIRAKELAED